MAAPSDFLSPKQVAAELGYSRKTIERAVAAGEFPNAIRLNRAIRIPESDVKALKAKATAKKG